LSAISFSLASKDLILGVIISGKKWSNQVQSVRSAGGVLEDGETDFLNVKKKTNRLDLRCQLFI
jgi:hypothetical protein